MTFTLKIPGQLIAETTTSQKLDSDLTLKTRKTIQLGATRGGATSVNIENVAPDDAVCLHYADGLELWMSAGELADRANTGGVRGAPGKADCYEVTPALFSQGTARGGLGMAVTALEVVGVDLPEKGAKIIAEWFEEKQLEKREGVFPVDLSQAGVVFGAQIEAQTATKRADRGEGAAPTGTIPVGDQPLLVFLHGTASSFGGSYGRLWDKDNAKGATLRDALTQKYAGRVYALEHRSLTVSPIDNALDLAKLLPVDAKLHLVSHSRGGLVGELLCLAGQRGETLSDEVLGLIFKEDRTQADLMGFGRRDMKSAYAGQLAKLKELLDLLDSRKIRVTRFVRAACPAMGTTLASGKLDRWLSLLKFAGGVGVVPDIRDFLLAVVKERTDPRTLPGLEAMMPGSALVRLLNLEGLKVDADLSVIAGDCGDKSIWDRLKFALADWFFEGDHDLVVNTGSMYGGLRRQDNQARKYFTRGSAVNHFHYFLNGDSVEKLSSGLLRDEGTLGGFDPLRVGDRKAPARAAPRVYAGPHPVAFVLPGIMGSSLAEQGEEIWLNTKAIFRGRMARLGIENENVTAVAPLEKYYGDFIEFLGRTHEVVPFAYDWRRSVTESAAALHEAILKKLAEAEAGRQPLRIVAHSMGGLVVRAMLALHPQTWNRLKNLEGFRLMMLGTPNYGAFQAVRLVVGQYRVANVLAGVDIHHNRNELLELFSRYPGAAELLPWKNTGNRDFAATELWAGLKTEADESWPLPDQAALAQARATWKLLNTAPIDGGCMVYVAGWAHKTACDYRVLRRDDLIQGNIPQIEFSATRRGDGTVPWDLGRLEGVKTWYADAEHGSLLADSRFFPAYLELLQTGKTVHLPDCEPEKSRGAAAEPLYLPLYLPLPPDLGEGCDGLDSLGGFGVGGLPPTDGARRRLPGVTIQVKCGDLAYASNPVCVGHYQGDTVVSAEKQLDKALGNALSDRQHMGIYPGRLGTWEIFIQENRQAKPGGALVIGLGQVGELAPGSLEKSISRVMSDYALQVMQWHDERFGKAGAVRSARVSFLLIGTGAGGIEVRNSVEAILRGVKRANEKLADSKLDHRVLIDKIELLELYQDIAIQAARALDDVLADPELAAHFTWSPREILDSNGHRRILCEEAPNWWQRLEITQDKAREELRFIALTNRARAEETLVAGDLRLAKDFIRQSIATTQSSREVSRTLFEMLLPNRLKQLAPDRHDLVLVVDEDSAAYPWELLEDRWTDGKEPPAVVAGMVRQFKTDIFRDRPAHADADNAFVVGNPRQTLFGNLPGARDEAEKVVRVLGAGGFHVRQEIETGADAIMIGLHGDAYRILHLAGHGVHEWQVEKPDPCDNCRQAIPGSQKTLSGMVIGNDSFLTAGDVRQMRWVPELVFLNCCHLGNTHKSSESARKFNYLAANLAVEFIRMGVKAVIAAGWAVDDAAAKAFAGHFYQRMLADEPFGRAVQGARKAIFDAYPGVNTWGAYQCYGDPDFRLYNKASGSAKPAPQPFYTRAELVVALENLARAERTGNGDEKIIEEILARIPSAQRGEWLNNADALAALGFAYSELGDLEKAVECLDKAIMTEKPYIPLRFLEKRANLKAQLAERLTRKERNAENAARSDKLFKAAFKEIRMLLELGKTAERYNVLASAWKRKAMVATSDDKRIEYLEKMRDSYKSAETVFNADQEKNNPNEAERARLPYATVNKWTAEILLAKQAPPDNWGALLEECRAAAEWAETQDEDKPGFRYASVVPDSLLVQTLAQKNLAEKKEDILESYRHAKGRGTSQRAFTSVLDQFDFLVIMLPHCHARDQLGELQKIMMAIRLFADGGRD